MRPFVRAAFMCLLPIALAGIGDPAEARITKLQINSRAVAYGGASFGSVGQYETLRGVAFGEVDPHDPLNEVITDIKLAPRNARGMVEYNMDFWISKPVDMTRANGTLLHDVPNRGNVRSRWLGRQRRRRWLPPARGIHAVGQRLGRRPEHRAADPTARGEEQGWERDH